jgi:hypothetical protein
LPQDIGHTIPVEIANALSMTHAEEGPPGLPWLRTEVPFMSHW